MPEIVPNFKPILRTMEDRIFDYLTGVVTITNPCGWKMPIDDLEEHIYKLQHILQKYLGESKDV